MLHYPTIANPIEPPDRIDMHVRCYSASTHKVAQDLLRLDEEILVLTRSLAEIFQRLPHVVAAFTCAHQGFVEEVRRASVH